MCAWGAPQIAIDFWTSQNDCHGTSGFAKSSCPSLVLQIVSEGLVKLSRTHHLFIF